MPVLAWALLGAFRFPLGLAGTPAVAAGLPVDYANGTVVATGMRNEAGHWPEVCKKSLQAMVGDIDECGEGAALAGGEFGVSADPSHMGRVAERQDAGAVLGQAREMSGRRVTDMLVEAVVPPGHPGRIPEKKG